MKPIAGIMMRSLFRVTDRFRRDRRGNVAVIFTLALLPILTAIGCSIDYSRASRARASMQAALDSTALMVSKDLSQGLITTAQVNAKAQAYFTALYTDTEAQSITVGATYTLASGNSGPTVQVTGSGSIPTDFMKVVGLPNVGFGTSSTAAWGSNLLRVALVLDNTGSMTSFNKIGALKTAAQNLVTQLSGIAQNPGDVYISVIPFEIDVNVGNTTSNLNASWLRWDLWDPSQDHCTGTYINATVMSYAACLGHNFTWHHSVGSPNHSLWNGCVSDRDQNNDVNAVVPSSQATNFPADQDDNCPTAQIRPLTYNWTDVNSTITAMTASGATNQTIGLQWGWLSLLQQSPLNAPAENSSLSYQHIIVLFTDGLNTGDRWYGDLSDTSTQVDTRMATLCTAIKAAGVTIYTVQIDTDGAGQSAVLPACASAPANFFMLTAPSQIAAAFAQIGTSISKLRVAR
jgi:Flp pilus assembly protein TadG